MMLPTVMSSRHNVTRDALAIRMNSVGDVIMAHECFAHVCAL